MKYLQEQTYKSADFGLLKTGDSNRQLNEQHVLDLMVSIRDSGQIVPIVVNEDMVIIDGQHRFEACRRLCIPFLFIIRPDLDESDIIEVNTTQRPWDNKDFIDLHAKTNESYRWFKEQKNSLNCAISAVFMLAKGTEMRGEEREAFQSGKFSVTQAERKQFAVLAKQVLEIFAAREGTCRGVFCKPRMLYGVRKMMLHPNYIHSDFMHILNETETKFRKVQTYQESCERLEAVYNKGRKKESYKIKLSEN